MADPGCGNLRVKKQHAAANGPLCEGNSPHRGEMSRSQLPPRGSQKGYLRSIYGFQFGTIFVVSAVGGAGVFCGAPKGPAALAAAGLLFLLFLLEPGPCPGAGFCYRRRLSRRPPAGGQAPQGCAGGRHPAGLGPADWVQISGLSHQIRAVGAGASGRADCSACVRLPAAHGHLLLHAAGCGLPGGYLPGRKGRA